MAELQFEWDENKNNINIKKHGVSFEYTIRAENDNEVVRIISARQAEASEIREYIQVRPGGENL